MAFSPGEIINYRQMCDAEESQLQRGMNFRMPTGRTIVLMSRRTNAPYVDAIEDNGKTIIYEGHDVPTSNDHPIPKLIDQPGHTPSGTLTQNGKFLQSAKKFKTGEQSAESVMIYEKLQKGIWGFQRCVYVG